MLLMLLINIERRSKSIKLNPLWKEEVDIKLPLLEKTYFAFRVPSAVIWMENDTYRFVI